MFDGYFPNGNNAITQQVAILRYDFTSLSR